MILVTQSFGRESEYRRVALAILSFYAYSNNFAKTILFTDNPEWFEKYFTGLPVSYNLLTPSKMKEMRGKIDFLHRMKIALIEKSFELYNDDILYFDSDTFFLADPHSYMKKLSPQKSFMHLWEYQFESLRNMPLPAGQTFQAFVKLIEDKSFKLNNSGIKVSAEMSSWNAGVMMLHSSHSKFIPEVYQLTEAFFPPTQNHASEQYAFSILLQSNTELKACEEVIYHYWYNIKKSIIDTYLPQKLDDFLKITSLENRLGFIKSITKQLPLVFENHLFTLKDNAVQAFNTNNFAKGYSWAIKAIFAGAIKEKIFIRDVLYHLKRQVKGR